MLVINLFFKMCIAARRMKTAFACSYVSQRSLKSDMLCFFMGYKTFMYWSSPMEEEVTSGVFIFCSLY